MQEDSNLLQENTFLKFEWNIDDWIKIQDLSEALIWYDKFLRSSFKAFDINIDNIDIKIFDIRKGSIIVDIALQYQLHNLFISVNSFLDILKIVDLDLFNYIQDTLVNTFWTNIEINFKEIDKAVENYCVNNPWKSMLYFYLLTKVIEKIYDLIVNKKIKHSKVIDDCSDDQEIDLDWVKVKWKYLKKLKNNIINKWKAKELLNPIIDDDIEVIKIWNDENIINTSNINLFLWEWNQILPFLLNWHRYKFVWSFTAMQSNKWETMKFKSQIVNVWWKNESTKNKHWEDFLFVVNLPYWETTEDYTSFYWESKILELTAEVIRDNEYKKPKLRLLTVDLINKPLFDIEEENLDFDN